VLLAGLSPIAAEILVGYLTKEAGFETAGMIDASASIHESMAAADADVVILGADVTVTRAEQNRLFASYPDLSLISISSDERSTCSCSRASPQDLLRRIRSAAHADGQ
jgi:hypothetical protein